MHTPEIVGNVELENGPQFGPGVRLLADRFGRIKIGRRCNFKAGVVIACYGGNVEIGDRVSLGEYIVIYGHGGVFIDRSVAIGPHCAISSQEHIVGSQSALRFSGERHAAVRIEFGAIISAHCVITAGVTIGSHALVGAGSVVVDSVPTRAIAFGSPCRVQKIVERNALYGTSNN